MTQTYSIVRTGMLQRSVPVGVTSVVVGTSATYDDPYPSVLPVQERRARGDMWVIVGYGGESPP